MVSDDQMERLEQWAEGRVERTPGTLHYRVAQLEALNETLLTHNASLQRDVDTLKAELASLERRMRHTQEEAGYLWARVDWLTSHAQEDGRQLDRLEKTHGTDD
jgi:predicted RNase H-like nuclease (RuvC/YqgF family)